MPWTSPADQTTGHVVTSTEWNQVVDDLVFLHDKGADLASAATLPSPVTQYHVVTGTTTITSIPILAAGCRLVLLFTGVCKVTSGGTLKLRGDFGSAVNDTLSLISDGTNWYETGRSNVGAQLDYAQITASITGISNNTEGGAAAVITGGAVIYDGTKVRIEFSASFLGNTSLHATSFVLLYDSTVIGQASYAPSNGQTIPVSLVAYHTPTADGATHAYSVKVFVSANTSDVIAGAGGSGAQLPAFMRVTRAV